MGLDEEIFLYVARYLQMPSVKMLGRFAAGLELGDQLASFCILFIMAGYLWQKPRFVRAASAGLFALATSGIVVQIVKYLIGRARPSMDLGAFYFIGPHFFPRGYDSFPSGHTTAFFALAAFLCRYYPNWSIPLYSGGFLLSVLGRVVTEQHFFSDVIGGVILGAGVGIFLASRFRGFVEPSQPSRAPSAIASSPARKRQQPRQTDPQVREATTMLKELLVIIAFSSATLFIGLDSSDLEFSSRLFSASFGLLTALATYFLARELCGKEAGAYSVLILSSSFLFVNVGRVLPADTAWLFFTVLAFLCYIYSAKRRSRSNLVLAFSYASIGAGMLAKGSLALFPAVVFLLYEHLREKPPWAPFIFRSGLRHGLFSAFTVLAAAPWLGHGIFANQEGAAAFFLDEAVAQTGLTRHAGRVIYYLPLLLLALFPWTFFLIAYFVKEGKRWLKKTLIHPHPLLLLLWAAVVFGLFPFSAVKFPHTMVLALPPLSCLLGRFMKAEILESHGSFRLSLLTTVLFAACLSLAAATVYFLRPPYTSKFIVPFAILTCFLLIGWLLKDRSRWNVAFAMICLGGLAFYISASVL